MNDDLVQPSRGFGTHPHRDVEICTYIVNGHLTHKDSMGTAETITRGAIQFMTAGTGVEHSEHNLDPNNDLRFIQIWINTRKRGLPPNYGSSVGDAKSRLNQFAHLVSDVQDKDSSTPISINQDANIYVAEVEKSHGPVTFEVKDGRQCYILCVEGVMFMNGNDHKLMKHDAAEVAGPITLMIEPQDDIVHCLVVEMKFDGSGRTDVKASS